jgi:hypothetical protein
VERIGEGALGAEDVEGGLVAAGADWPHQTLRWLGVYTITWRVHKKCTEQDLSRAGSDLSQAGSDTPQVCPPVLSGSRRFGYGLALPQLK